MSKSFSETKSWNDRQQGQFVGSPDDKTAVRIVDVSKLEWKKIEVAYPSSIEEEYSYINDDLQVMYKIKIVYTNASKNNIATIERL